MDKLQNNNIRIWIKAISIMILVLLLIFVGLSTGDAGSADIGRIAEPGCIGTVRTSHIAGETAGEIFITLPDDCQHGTVLLGAESIGDGQAVIANYRLSHGYLTIETTLLNPLPYPVQPKVSYEVIP